MQDEKLPFAVRPPIGFIKEPVRDILSPLKQAPEPSIVDTLKEVYNLLHEALPNGGNQWTETAGRSWRESLYTSTVTDTQQPPGIFGFPCRIYNREEVVGHYFKGGREFPVTFGEYIKLNVKKEGLPPTFRRLPGFETFMIEEGPFSVTFIPSFSGRK